MTAAHTPERLREAFLTTIEAEADRLFRHCYCRLLDREEGKEAVEETFARAWAAVASGRAVADLCPLLYRIANGVIQDLRKGTDTPAAPGNEPLLIRRLRLLPDAERDAFVLRSIDGFSQTEAAKILRVSGSLIAARLRGGRHVFLSLTRYE